MQLPPAVALVLALALLLEAAGAGYGPAAGDNGSGVAAAITLTRALAADPPRNLTVELVLQGAGESRASAFGDTSAPTSASSATRTRSCSGSRPAAPDRRAGG